MKKENWVSLQIRPVGDFCNFSCGYCNYGKVAEKSVMSEEVLEALTRKFISHNSDLAVFCWHGGEPTLAGIDFFKKAVGYQEKYGKRTSIINSIQTNGTTITPPLADFFRRSNFNVGISIDGPKMVHDRMRISKDGFGSYARAIKGLNLLKKFGVRFSVIATVSKNTLPFAEAVFEHLVGLGFKNISYSPVFDSPCGEYPSITNDEWFSYMNRVFKKWFALGNQEIQIREIDEVISWISGSVLPCCSSLGTCSHWFAINPNGDIFPCEKLGRSVCFSNILRDNFANIQKSPMFKAFVSAGRKKPEKCKYCKFFKFCHNGCRQMRVKDSQFSPSGLYGFCGERLALFRRIDNVFKKVLTS